jgi:enterochelin esterase-like enzyme/outer membrane protein assembly factor BamB
MKIPAIAVAFTLLEMLALGAARAADPPPPTAEWPSLRGPDSDGSAPAGATFRGPEGSNLSVVWRSRIGSGYAVVAVAEGRAVTLFSDGARDVVAAFDAASGKELWRHAAEATYKGHDGSFDGPIATPAVAGGRVFAFFNRGSLVALDLATGRVLWTTDVVKDLGGEKPYYGYGASPLVAGGVVVVEVGGKKARAVVGFDPATGARRWALGDDVVNYQSPLVLSLGGREQLVAVGDKKLIAVDPAKGRVLWEHAYEGDGSPIGSGSMVPVPAGEGRLFVKNRSDSSSMLKITPKPDGTASIETLWTKPVLRSSYSIPVYHDGFLYGINGRTVLTCVDAATGEQRWRSREPGDGFLLEVGGDLVVVTKDRTLHVAPASPEGWKERARVELFQDLVWTPPSFADGAVFARSQAEIVRVEWRAAEARPASTSPALPTGRRFARFLEEVAAAEDKGPVVDRFLAEAPSFPVVEWPDLAVFLYRGPADDMGIAGDPVGERREDPMTRVPGTDLFWYAARYEPDTRLSYQFVRNFDERIVDPRNPRKVPFVRLTPKGPETVEASSLAMPGWTEPKHLQEAPPSRRGRLETLEVKNDAGAKLPVSVYLPAGYDGGSERLPTVYVIDGDGARDAGRVPGSLDHLVGDSVAPLVAVFVGDVDWGKTKPKEEEENQATAELLVRHVVPAVDARFRTRAEPSSRAVIGHGFVGFLAAYSVFHFPGVFELLATQSLAMLSSTESDLQKEVRTAEERPLRLYMDWGRYDMRGTREAWDMAETNRRVAAFLRERGYRPAGGESNDGAGWASWRNRTDRLFESLFPLPKTATR